MNALARFVALGFLPVVLLAAGCTSQGEGERCAINADCQTNLICVTVQSSTNIAVCCPAAGGSSVPLCNGSVTFDAGAAGAAGAGGAGGASGASGAGGEAEAGADVVTEEAGGGSTEDVSTEAAGD
jgi:hypothetical protein